MASRRPLRHQAAETPARRPNATLPRFLTVQCLGSTSGGASGGGSSIPRPPKEALPQWGRGAPLELEAPLLHPVSCRFLNYLSQLTYEGRAGGADLGLLPAGTRLAPG